MIKEKVMIDANLLSFPPANAACERGYLGVQDNYIFVASVQLE